MEQEEPFYEGTLFLPPAGKLLLKKAWHQKHCLLFKSSKFGIERLEVYDDIDLTKDSKESKIITLKDCIKVYSKGPTTICITTNSATYEFATTTEQSMNDWLIAIQSVAFPDEVSKTTCIEEDNDLYCSSGEETFNVKLVQSPASKRCGLENKKYLLVLTSTTLQLRNVADGGDLLFTWPYCYIRRYGYKGGKFTFEAGRMCESGEGTFLFEHLNQKDIFSSKRKCWALPSPILDCGELQLQAALNMEARSRTPLPPSPTSSPSIQESNLSNKSQFIILDVDQRTLRKIKPPRKYVPSKTPICNGTDECTYEPIDKYDQIEYRTEAWRTLGVDEPNHSEQVSENGEEEYKSWGYMKKELDNIKPPVPSLAPKMVTECSTTDLNDTYYDKLNFFGSSSKLNVKSGYRQVLPPPITNACPPPPAFNEYDEVLCLDMQPARPADDSHLGYALVRKDPGKDALKEVVIDHDDKNGKKNKGNVSHQFHNEEPYAIISKPKQV
ncbi:hypothetical protein NQ317_006761 [Molorchus minor]|uniref:Insulin receptor substrate 1 n=1 Tax=Molorchus minor TaxID=1323400 RepID=A0ABQ9JPZ1_9CUCU|nr:hypothetical protein NQ317_006761 [Molorchus minor]